MKRVLPIFISVFLMIMNVLSAQASENILRGVDVKCGSSSYTIELTSTVPAYMNKTIVSANRIIINLKNIDISNNLTTKFNGNSVIDNVIVEPCGRNNVNIMVQGDNIAYSTIEFKSPSKMEIAEDSVKSSITSVLGIFSGSSKTNKKIQYGTLFIFLLVLIGEIKFIKSKYRELEQEKAEMLRNIEQTADFKDYLPSYGRTGLKRPYTTPVYGNYTTNIPVNTAVSKPKISRLKTPETITLNSILSNTNNEQKIINRIVNNAPMFGTLSGDSHLSNPIVKKQLSSIKHLETLTSLYKAKAEKEYRESLHKRLNKIY